MKRHGFSGQRASHGVKKVHRHQGGTGMCQSPGRLFKGKKMAGRFGNERSTYEKSSSCGYRQRSESSGGARRSTWAEWWLCRCTANQQSEAFGWCWNARYEEEGCKMNLTVYNAAGKQVGKYEIDPSELSPKINKQLLHDAVVMYQANLRQGTFRTKSRGEVSGTTKKMYRQKGTGNARAGSKRSGVRRGGGHIFRKTPTRFQLENATKSASVSHSNGVSGSSRR